MKTSVGHTTRQFSCPCVTTSPSASRSLNFAGRKSRPFSSSFGVYVPMKNIGHLHSSPFLHFAPLYATFPHRQPFRACRHDVSRPFGAQRRSLRGRVCAGQRGPGDRATGKWGGVGCAVGVVGADDGGEGGGTPPQPIRER